MTKLIPTPPLHTVLHHAADLAELYPHQTSQHAYLDNHGNPHCLVGHIVARVGGDLSAFEGNRVFLNYEQGSPWNGVRVSGVWERIFDEPAFFLGLQSNRDTARAFLTYSFLNHLQAAQDSKRYAQWNKAVPRALREFRRYLLNPASGFLVQTRGNFHGLQHGAIVDVDLMLNRLNAK